MRSHLILPIFPQPPSHFETRRAEIRGEPSPAELNTARYAVCLIDVLKRRFDETQEIDYAIADRIESVLWPKEK